MTTPHPCFRQTHLTDFFQDGSVHEGEGCNRTTTVTGADAWITHFCADPANSGQPPPRCHGTCPSPQPYTGVQKRSYKRACKRALTSGCTRYRGREVSLRDFPSNLIARVQQEQSRQRRPAPHPSPTPVRHSRMTLLHWNPGGMAQSTFQEFKHWLTFNPTDAVVITETRWSFSSCWQDQRWSYIHSAALESRTGGILIMIARHICHPDNIGYDEQRPGRLVHVRMHFDRRAVNLLALYQYVDNRNQQSTQARAGIWQALNESLYRMPSRNSLILAGDFNCSLPRAAPWIGTNAFKWNGRRRQGRLHADHDQLLTIIRQHALVDLTSWDESQGPTYIHGDTASKIDHVFMRLTQCDGIAKQTQFLPNADIIPNNQTHHVPVSCSIKTRMMPYQVQQLTPTCTYTQRSKCRQASLQESDTWISLQNAVTNAVRQIAIAETPDAAICNLHDMVAPIFQTLFPKAKHSNTSDSGPVHVLMEINGNTETAYAP